MTGGIDNFDDFYGPQIKHQNIGACLADKDFPLIEAGIRDRIFGPADFF